jgi:hypothetical protein
MHVRWAQQKEHRRRQGVEEGFYSAGPIHHQLVGETGAESALKQAIL